MVLIFIFIGLRVIPAPEFLTEYGFRPRDNEGNREQWASLPVQYISSSVCVDCHPDKHDMWEKGNHRTISCENCHGPAMTHAKTGAPLALNTSRELCGLCHAKLVSRPSNFPQVDIEEMGGNAECVTCHDPHEPRAGMPPQVPHTLEGRTECQLCHGPHEPWTEPPPEIPHTLEGRTKCLSCHGPKEFRGATLPRIPHTLEGRTDCLTCHNTGAIKPVPEDHVGRTSITCTTCHQLAEASTSASALLPTPAPVSAPPIIPHALEGHDDCLMCHASGAIAVSVEHAGLTSDVCLNCHRTGQGER
ncbi:MAG: cytochrome c3 family protein [Dehalococcoidales bacterium]